MASRGDTIDRAIALKTDQEVVDRLRLRMPEAIEQLEQIACGNVPRNAQSILKGIETMLRFSQPLPKTTIEHQGAVGISIVDPYAETPREPDAPVKIAPSPVPPLRRPKASP